MKRTPSAQEIRSLQARSVGYLLIRSAELWNQRAIRRVNSGRPEFRLREAHTRLFPHLLEPGGIRITELARRLSVTKQAIQPLVADLVKARVVRLESDPDDGRARRVVLSAGGARAMQYGTSVLLAVERELATELGARRMAQVRKLLGDLLVLLEVSDESAEGPSPTRSGRLDGPRWGHGRRTERETLVLRRATRTLRGAASALEI